MCINLHYGEGERKRERFVWEMQLWWTRKSEKIKWMKKTMWICFWIKKILFEPKSKCWPNNLSVWGKLNHNRSNLLTFPTHLTWNCLCVSEGQVPFNPETTEVMAGGSLLQSSLITLVCSLLLSTLLAKLHKHWWCFLWKPLIPLTLLLPVTTMISIFFLSMGSNDKGSKRC